MEARGATPPQRRTRDAPGRRRGARHLAGLGGIAARLRRIDANLPRWRDAIQGRLSRCTCRAHTAKGTSAAGTLEIAPGASLLLSGCDQVSSLDEARFECGAENGFHFLVQGALLHDASIDGDVVVRAAAQPDRVDRFRVVVSAPIQAAPGDWFQVRSGPQRSHVHRIDEVEFSGCPDASGCYLDLVVHDPDMAFGRSPVSSGYAVDLAYLAAPGDVRIAGADDPNFSSDDLAHCVEACSVRAGDDCVEANTIARDLSHVGWYFGATPTLDPADPVAMGKRHLIVASYNDVPQRIGPGTGLVDRICFADSLVGTLTPASGDSQQSGVIWPGFWPGDAWAVFRPATVRYTGTEFDGGLGFHHACVDADHALFEDWARIATKFGTPACQRPYQDTVIISQQRGDPNQIAQQAGAGGCNGRETDRSPGTRR